MLKTRNEILKVIKIIMNLRIGKKKGKCNFSSTHRGVNGDGSHQFTNEAPALCLTPALPQSQGSLRAVSAISLAFRLPASSHPGRAVRPVPGSGSAGGDGLSKKQERRREGGKEGRDYHSALIH